MRDGEAVTDKGGRGNKKGGVDVCFWHIADINPNSEHVRSWG